MEVRLGEDEKHCWEIRRYAVMLQHRLWRDTAHHSAFVRMRHCASEQSMKGRKEKESVCLAHFCLLLSFQSEFAPMQVIFLLLTEEMRLKQSAEVTIEGQRVVSQILQTQDCSSTEGERALLFLFVFSLKSCFYQVDSQSWSSWCRTKYVSPRSLELLFRRMERNIVNLGTSNGLEVKSLRFASVLLTSTCSFSFSCIR